MPSSLTKKYLTYNEKMMIKHNEKTYNEQI